MHRSFDKCKSCLQSASKGNERCTFRTAKRTRQALHFLAGVYTCQFELNKHYDDTSPWHHSSVMMFSTDGGHSWPEYAITSNDPENHVFYWDQRPGLLSDGRILNLFWTYDNRAATYLNIHARESMDHGRSWSEMWDTGVPGQPSPPVSLPDGTIAMAHVDRTGAPLIKMLASSDGGRIWSDRSEIVLYGTDTECQTWNKHAMRDAWAEMGKFSVGLPATALLPDGDVLVVYYAGPETDQTDIRWVRVRAV